ncbi:MAG: hypothetical protein ABI151_07495 [Chitinophagaceae bacterium]
MTALWIILSLVLPALLGWLIALTLLNALRSSNLLETMDFSTVGVLLEKKLMSPEILHEKFLNPENYQKLVPQIEKHIDYFLRVKLKEDMPVVGMMIGDRTINQMKGIFLKELEQLFPEVISAYLSNMTTDGGISGLLESHLKNNPLIGRSLVTPMIKRYAFRVQIFGSGAGLATGILQMGIYFLAKV